MAAKLSNSDLILMVRLQHRINDHVFNNPPSEYNNALEIILKSIEQFFIDHVYDSHTTLAFHRELQSNFDRLLNCISYDEYLSFLRKTFIKK